MNLLLISVDSLRLDFAPGISGAVHTPNFCNLTRDYHLSEHCFSVSSATRPVHTSLFTGLYPFEHGIEGQRSAAMRQGFPDLFELCLQAGYSVRAFSEAVDIFTGLRFAQHISPLPDHPHTLSGLTQNPDPTFLFLHYWGVHTPYGAADGLAFGEIGQLLSAGRLDMVQERYCNAIERLFEFSIAPILAGLDLEQWAVIILSDHGESWRSDEPYHGQSLRNDVLRVPLYYHIPGSENLPPARPLISLLDLFPTMLSLLELDHTYQGFARPMHAGEAPLYYLAEIDPGPMADGPVSHSELFPSNSFGRQWSLFDNNAKFTYDEASKSEELVGTFSQQPIIDFDHNRQYHQAYADLKSASAYVTGDFTLETDRDLLLERLRKLGYLT